MLNGRSSDYHNRYGTYSVAEALNAGLDLEMPGPPRWRELNLVNHMISSRKLLPDTITTRAETVVKFVHKIAKLSPEVVYGDGKERSRDTPEIRQFGRRVAAEGMVLLKNEQELLPLVANGRQRQIAVIGPNAKGRVISGGGSAYLKATYIVSPWEGLQAAAPKGVKLEYAVGCYGKSSFHCPSGLLDLCHSHSMPSFRFLSHLPIQHISIFRHWRTNSSLRTASLAGSVSSTLTTKPTPSHKPKSPATSCRTRASSSTISSPTGSAPNGPSSSAGNSRTTSLGPSNWGSRSLGEPSFMWMGR